MLVKPLTYMNLSGTSIRDLLAFRRVIGRDGVLPPHSPQGDGVPPPHSPQADGISPPQSPRGGAEGVRAAGEAELAADGSQVGLRDVLLVIYDDLDLPFGHLRFRTRGSSGGHRGLGSIIRELKTERFSRLKVGIGRDDEQVAEDYVLEPLRGEFEYELMDAARSASETIPSWLENGVVACEIHVSP